MNIDNREARQLIDDYFATFPKVQTYMEQAKETCRAKGYAETLFHRRRYLPDILSANATVRGFAERNAINAPIQGSEADIIKVAMIRIHDRFRREGIRSKMILQVHDELNFSVSRRKGTSGAHRHRGDAAGLSPIRSPHSRCRLGQQLAGSALTNQLLPPRLTCVTTARNHAC